MPNCKRIIPDKCKADCCGVVPIPDAVWTKHVSLANHDMIVGIDNTTFPEQIVPITRNLACAFLSEDFMCKIYKDRPECCRRFGEVAELKCPHEL